MGLQWHDGWLAHAQQIVDRWHHHSDVRVDPLEVLRHPATVRAASALGYDVERLDVAALEARCVAALEARYLGRPDAGLDRIGRYA